MNKIVPFNAKLADDIANVHISKTCCIPSLSITLNHGSVILNNVNVGVTEQLSEDCILGKPILAYLGILPEQILAERHLHKMFNAANIPMSVEDVLKMNAVYNPIDVQAALDQPPPELADEVEEDDNDDIEIPPYLKNNFNHDMFKNNKFQDSMDLLKAFAQKSAEYGRKREASPFRQRLPSVKAFMDLLLEFSDVFRTEFGGDGPAKVTPMPFKQRQDTADLVGHARHQVNLSADAERWLVSHMEMLEQAGIIKKILPSDGHVGFSEPVFVIPKPKTNKFRMIEDVRRVNKVAEPFAYPLPTIERITTALKGSQCFGSFDMIKGYNQFPVTDSASFKFTITTILGLYRFCRLPMGFVNSVSWYQFVMTSEVLPHLLYKSIISYLDDLLMYSKSPEEYFASLRQLLKALRMANVKANINKCNLYDEVIIFIGRQFSALGMRPNPDMVKSILNLGMPSTPRQLQQFYHAINWLRGSIPNFSRLIGPVHDLLEQQYKLTKKNKRTAKALGKLTSIVGWNATHAQIVKDVKDRLVHAAHHAYPDDTLDRHILLDASLDGWSLLVTQTKPDETDIPIQQREHQLLNCLSGRFRANQRSWHITSKEAYPLFVASTKLKYLLHPVGKPVHIWTDHKNLLLLFSPDKFHSKTYTIDRLLRWCLQLSSISYVIHHIPGEINLLADYFSRKFRSSMPIIRAVKSRRAALSAGDILFRKNRIQAHLNDQLWPKLQKIVDVQQASVSKSRSPPPLDYDNSLSIFMEGDKPWIPRDESLISSIIIIAHLATGHMGAATTLELIKSKFHVDLSDKEFENRIKDFIRLCFHCRPRRLIIRRRLGTQWHATERFQILHVDYLFIRGSQENDPYAYQYVLVLMDDYSKLVQLTPAEAPTAEVAVDALLRFEAAHSLNTMPVLISDKGSHFTSALVNGYCKSKGVKQRFTVPYAPFSNGTIERPNREILAFMRSLLSQQRLSVKLWSEITPIVEGLFNRLTRKSLHGKSPLGISHNLREEKIARMDMCLFLDGGFKPFSSENIAQKEFDNIERFFESWHKKHVDIRTRINARSLTKFLNFDVGDWVNVALPKVKRKSKVHFRWSTPAQVVELKGQHLAVVKFLGKDRLQEVHTCHLAFYDSNLDGTDQTVSEQVLYDDESWEVEKLLALVQDESHNYFLKTKWRGFHSSEDSLEPIESLYDQIPIMVVNFLTGLGTEEAKLLLNRLES